VCVYVGGGSNLTSKKTPKKVIWLQTIPNLHDLFPTMMNKYTAFLNFYPQKEGPKTYLPALPTGDVPLESFLLRPYICCILLCIKHSYNRVFVFINVLTELVEQVFKICFFYMLK